MAQTADGARKLRARHFGMTIAQMEARERAGFRYCGACRYWLPIEVFRIDKSRIGCLARKCSPCHNAIGRKRYSPVPADRRKPMGPSPKPEISGNKLQARARVNKLVKTGRKENPNNLPCVDCGHLGKDRRHDYDHHEGYAAGDHLNVEVRCTVCHAAATRARGELIQHRDHAGRFTSSGE